MNSLVLNKTETFAIRDSWATLSATHNEGDKGFIGTVFANLLSSNPRVNALLKDNGQIETQKILISELMDVLMTYMDDAVDLDEHLNTFIQDNPSIVKFGGLYLEPLGAIFVKTLRQFLGPMKFHSRLESLWVEVYISVANFILQNEISDSESLFSNTINSTSSLEEEIQPLNCQKVPSFLNSCLKVPVNLEDNEKYKGFRRSSLGAGNSQSASTVSVRTSNSPEPFSCSFSEIEPQLTPRSTRRNSSASAKSCDNKDGKSVFDPRGRPLHRKTSSDSSLKLDKAEIIPSSGASRTRLNKGEILEIDTEDMTFSNDFHASLFDCNSFGIAGLAPIAECGDVEDSEKPSFKRTNLLYGGHERSDSISSGSRSSSLSLYDSKQMSPTSSTHSTSVKGYKSESGGIPILSMSTRDSHPLYQKRYSNSVPSFASHTSTRSASIGFMKSSYVLKEKLNGTDSQKDGMLGTVCEGPSRRPLPFSQSSTFLAASFARNDDTNTFSDLGSDVKNRKFASSVHVASSPESPVKSGKSSFRSILRKLFGAQSKPTKNVSKGDAYRTRVKSQAMPVSGVASNASQNLSTRLNVKEIKQGAAPNGFAASVYSRPSAPGDLSSVLSTDHRSVLSFDTGTSNSRRTTNKYLVKKVPYRTVSLKDLIA